MLRFKEFLKEYEEVKKEIELEEINEDVKVIPIKGKIKLIKASDMEKVFGGGKKPIKKAGFVIAKKPDGTKVYVPKSKKKGAVVKWDSKSSKFVYHWDKGAARKKAKMMKKIAKRTGKKRARAAKKTRALRKK